MSDALPKRQAGKTASSRKSTTAKGQTVKVTLHLPVDTAQRLGVEAAMKRITQSAVAEGIMGPALRRWRLPSTIEPEASAKSDRAGAADPDGA